MGSSRFLRENLCSILLFVSLTAHIVHSPFTKVEESFNLQAIHDILFHSWDLKQYDHLEFPGVVPRTFIGAILVAIVSFPGNCMLYHFSFPKLWSQYLCRMIIGVVAAHSLHLFQSAISRKLGPRSGKLFLLLVSCQFHFPFYMTRTLPNTFATIACIYAYSNWLQDKHVHALVIIACAMIIFRCDLLVLLCPLTLQFLAFKKVPFWPTAGIGFTFSLLALLTTVLIDSMFWGKWMWPEGIVLFFNTVENKSSEWGTMPWHWYFSSALPKSLHISLLLISLGFVGVRYPIALTAGSKDVECKSITWPAVLMSAFGPPNLQILYYCAPVLAFIALYSNLPHKELRFIFPALPVLTMAGAVALDKMLPPQSSSISSSPSLSLPRVASGEGTAPSSLLFPLSAILDHDVVNDTPSAQGHDDTLSSTNPSSRLKAKKRVVDVLLSLGVAVMLCLSLALTGAFALAAHHNYPGGHALQQLLREHIPRALNAAPISSAGHTAMKNVSIHIDVAAAMTGVSRFGQEDKQHIAELRGLKQPVTLVYSKEENLHNFEQFDWLLTADPRSDGKDTIFREVAAVNGFHRLGVSLKKGLHVELRPTIFILSKKTETE